MLDFCDLPYQWFPPRNSFGIRPLVRLVNRLRHLPRTQRIVEVRVTGGQGLAALTRRSRVMLVVNHPTHADASILLEAARQLAVHPIFMAAYDVFLRSRLDGFIMQRLGAFSVDREGSDSRAMKQAAQVLARPGPPLTVFPEGNVYLENDRVTPFHDGAAFLALRAQKDRDDDPLFAVPVSIKATHLTDVRPTLRRHLQQLAAQVEADLADTPRPLEALRRVGAIALRHHLARRGLRVGAGDDPRLLIEHAAAAVLGDLEKTLCIEPKPGESPIDRVRQCRRLIHEARTDPARAADHAAAADCADQAMLAFRIVSYSGQYVADQPTLDRIAETTEKLVEDTRRQMIRPLGDRRALVKFADPIDLRPYLADAARLRLAVRRLTSDLESAVQTGLDELNAANSAQGARRWEDW